MTELPSRIGDELVTPEAPKRLSEAELRELAADVVEGRVFVTNSAEGLENAFGLLLALVDLGPIAESIGAIYERYEKAAPTGINGYPFFSSMQLLHVRDLQPLRDRMDEYVVARDACVKGDS